MYFRNKRCDQQFAGYSGRLCLSQCVAGQGTYEYDLAERRLQKINTEMNDAMVTHAFIDQYDKIWFHENEKALIYYDPLNHTAKRFPFTMFGKITTLYSEDAGEGAFFPVSGRKEAWLFDREHAEMVYINKLKQLSNDRANQRILSYLMLDNDGVLWLSLDEGVYCMNFPKKQFNLLSLSPQISRAGKLYDEVRALFQSKSGDILIRHPLAECVSDGSERCNQTCFFDR